MVGSETELPLNYGPQPCHNTECIITMCNSGQWPKISIVKGQNKVWPVVVAVHTRGVSLP